MPREGGLPEKIPQVGGVRVEDDVEGKALELLYANAFKRHPYRWPTIG